ncbi:signal peptidase II [Candidatus Fermentibacteria bacterium]|nr:signal peptidase II [Candidatus Fermentibacteria bacterium]
MTGPEKTRSWLLALLVLLVDQLTKRVALSELAHSRPVEVLGNVVRLCLRMNAGAAFSLSWGGPTFLLVFNVAAAALVCVLLARCGRCTPLTGLALGAILGGAVGNVLDRLLYGAVVDFIDVGAFGFRWPTFNVADIGITVGGLTLILFYRRPRAPVDETA